MIIKEVGQISPRFDIVFTAEGGLDPSLRLAVEDMILGGAEPQPIIAHAAEIWSIFE